MDQKTQKNALFKPSFEERWILYKQNETLYLNLNWFPISEGCEPGALKGVVEPSGPEGAGAPGMLTGSPTPAWGIASRVSYDGSARTQGLHAHFPKPPRKQEHLLESGWKGHLEPCCSRSNGSAANQRVFQSKDGLLKMLTYLLSSLSLHRASLWWEHAVLTSAWLDRNKSWCLGSFSGSQSTCFSRFIWDMLLFAQSIAFMF